jgi:PTS system nitrogen regulatory IIA component
MPFRNITLDELARTLGMDAREVRRFAERGTLPGHRVGGEWRFNQAQLLDWLQHEIHNLGEAHIRNLERAMADGRADDAVGGLLALEAIDVNLHATSRPSVLRELTRLAEQTGLVYDPAGIVGALEEREALRSTALAGGIAFPHPRRPLPYATAEPLICLARVRAGVPYEAPDGGLTDLFVLILSHDERQHLHTLARLALMFSGDLADRLRACDDAEAALLEFERAEAEALKGR